MEAGNADLEKHWLYRLIKVTYYAAFVFLICVISMFGFILSVNMGLKIELFYVVASWLASIIFIYTVLNIVKEGLLYIAFGKNFSWAWLCFSHKKNLAGNRQFKHKKNDFDLQNVEPIEAALIIIEAYINKKQPFFEWKPSNLTIPPKIDSIVVCSTICYCFYLYIQMLRKKFGKDVSLVVKQHIIIQLNKSNNLGETTEQMLSIIEDCTNRSVNVNQDFLLPSEFMEERCLAIYILINLKDSPCYIPLDERESLSESEWQLLVKKHVGDNDAILSACLEHVKKLTIEIYQPVVEKMEFKAESVRGLDVSPDFIWSAHPACFERHLQRRYKNQLFPIERRFVTQAEIDVARKQDHEDIYALDNQIQSFLNTLPSEFSYDIENEINVLRTKIDEYINRSYAVGGKALDFIIKLESVRKVLMDTWKIFLANNESGLQKLEKAESYHNSVDKSFQNCFIIQCTREDSPMRSDNEIVPSILSEDIETIKIFLLMLQNIDATTGQENLKKLQNDASKLIFNLQKQGDNPLLFREKFEAFGIKNLL